MKIDFHIFELEPRVFYIKYFLFFKTKKEKEMKNILKQEIDICMNKQYGTQTVY